MGQVRKRGTKMKKLIIILSILFVIFLTGCEQISPKQYVLNSVSLEKTDLSSNERYDNLRIFFGVENKADLTLNSKIEIKLNESCFEVVSDKELGDIPPKQSVRSYITISRRYSLPNNCIGKLHDVVIKLKDVNGKELDSKTLQIGIV